VLVAPASPSAGLQRLREPRSLLTWRDLADAVDDLNDADDVDHADDADDADRGRRLCSCE